MYHTSPKNIRIREKKNWKKHISDKNGGLRWPASLNMPFYPSPWRICSTFRGAMRNRTCPWDSRKKTRGGNADVVCEDCYCRFVNPHIYICNIYIFAYALFCYKVLNVVLGLYFLVTCSPWFMHIFDITCLAMVLLWWLLSTPQITAPW